MVNTLLNPNGRIPAGPFWQGIIILVIANVALNAASAYVNPFFGFIGILLLYPFICVYGKRFHDAGKTAWLVLAVIGAMIVLGLIAGAVLGMFVRPPTFDAAGDLSEVMAAQRAYAQQIFLPTVAINTLISLGIAFVVAQLPSDPNENKYGPPTTLAS